MRSEINLVEVKGLTKRLGKFTALKMQQTMNGLTFYRRCCTRT